MRSYRPRLGIWRRMDTEYFCTEVPIALSEDKSVARVACDARCSHTSYILYEDIGRVHGMSDHRGLTARVSRLPGLAQRHRCSLLHLQTPRSFAGENIHGLTFLHRHRATRYPHLSFPPNRKALLRMISHHNSCRRTYVDPATNTFARQAQ